MTSTGGEGTSDVKSTSAITTDAAVDCRDAVWQRKTELHRINVNEVHAKQVVVNEHLPTAGRQLSFLTTTFRYCLKYPTFSGLIQLLCQGNIHRPLLLENISILLCR